MTRNNGTPTRKRESENRRSGKVRFRRRRQVSEKDGGETRRSRIVDKRDVHSRHGCEEAKEEEKKGKERNEEAKRGKCPIPLPHISPPVSAAADETQRHFSSLSPTTSQLMTGCPLTLRQTQLQPHSKEGRD
ncbi:hypothetical protein BLNAU_12032 [Blattamonas nauphoetae]|uniref:Uncharacterized protein n=1 Tax=Blattamonas nauphoetae TaxID=2049346 RepID=A0ABQ9XNW9_9EUKA|nr:hypothetical protein BLNAU_12032 [Blattamonas nauphoetae]